MQDAQEIMNNISSTHQETVGIKKIRHTCDQKLISVSSFGNNSNKYLLGVPDKLDT